MLDAFLEWLATLSTWSIYLTLFCLAALENMFPPLPSDLALLLGSFLSHRGVTSPVTLVFLCTVANMATATAIYFFARRKGRTLFDSGWPRKLMPPSAQHALHEAYTRHGILGIFICRLLPGIRVAVTPFAGVIGIPPSRVLIPSLAATTVWYSFLATVGTLVGQNWEKARGFVEGANQVLLGIAIVAFAGFVYWIWRRGQDTPDVPEQP